MAKWHYAITAKKRANIVEESSATQKVSISGATEIIENKEGLFSRYDFARGKTSVFLNMILATLCLGSIILVSTIIIEKDILLNQSLEYRMASDIIATSGLFLTAVSFPSVKQKFMNTLRLGKLGNHLCLIFCSFALPIWSAAILFLCGLNERIANMISLACILISIWNFCCNTQYIE